jgi:hypothetical protein
MTNPPEDTRTENTGDLQSGRFQPSQSGNPSGGPKASRNRATLVVEELLDGEVEAYR